MVMDLKTKDADLHKGLEQGDRIVFDLMRTDKGCLITRIDKSIRSNQRGQIFKKGEQTA